MRNCAKLLLDFLALRFKPRARLEAEIIVLRRQLNVLRRATSKRPRLSNLDWLIFVWLYRLFPEILRAAPVVRPETVVRWHRRGFQLYWRWKSRFHGGRPRIPGDIRHAVKFFSAANSSENSWWGQPSKPIGVKRHAASPLDSLGNSIGRKLTFLRTRLT